MNLQLTASSEHQDLVKELRIDMDKNLKLEFHLNECCIYRVHKKLRNINEETYTPQMVSIGPFHYKNKGLTNMEKTKRNYMKNFLEQRITIKQQDDIFSFVKNNENEIRNCYAETSDLKNHEYMMMILYDAIFIIELFMRNNERNTSDPILSSMARSILTLDLVLLENQLPYFVLEEIYRLATCSGMPTFMEISRFFFGFFLELELIELTPSCLVKHFTDWKRVTLMEKYVRSYYSIGHIWDLPCATKLRDSGVKFKKTKKQGRALFLKPKHELQLPQLQIIDESECIFRNVMALEQCLYPLDTHICNYVYLMNSLIDTEKDVDLLVGRGIISISTSFASSSANMFNKLCQNISVSPTCYHEIGEELKKHYDTPMATLRRVYFSNLWRGTGTATAVTLLLFTVIQTICSFFQFV